jgi:hypothetical protein
MNLAYYQENLLENFESASSACGKIFTVDIVSSLGGFGQVLIKLL